MLAGSGHDVIDDCTLGIGVILHEPPFLLSQDCFRASVQLAVRGVGPEPISEQQHSVDLRTASRERVEIDVSVRPFEHPVLVPVRLSNVKSIATRYKCREVRPFVCRVGHDENDVNYGLGWQPRYGRRTHMLDS